MTGPCPRSGYQVEKIMNRTLTFLSRGLAVILPVGVGAAAVLFSGAFAQAPEGKEKSRPPVPVRILTLQPINVIPRVTGYGTVSPARDWRAVARVDGEVVETSPLLANGRIAPAGTMLMKIDDTDLRLALAQTDAQAAALDVKDETLAASLDLSRADLELSNAELRRQETLRTQGVATQAQLDQAGRISLAARAKVTELQNQIALNEAERSVLAAQRAIAERNLEFTTIRAPYDIRIGEVSAETGQVVTRGATLFTGEGTEAVEVTAQFPLGRIGPVVRALGDGGTVLDLSAKVRLAGPDHTAAWPARIERVADTFDARTQSANIVVSVQNPLGMAKPGERPPLRRNMFVEVALSAPGRKAIAIPSDAVQDGRAILIRADDTLEWRTVQPAYMIGDIAIVTQGLNEGDRLVVTDLSVVTPGMAVKPIEDKALHARIAASVDENGEARSKSGGTPDKNQ